MTDQIRMEFRQRERTAARRFPRDERELLQRVGAYGESGRAAVGNGENGKAERRRKIGFV